jgi:hypothetical protein
MIYLLIFYWIFAALFCFGAARRSGVFEEIDKIIVFIGFMIIGGIFFPLYLGRRSASLKFK